MTTIPSPEAVEAGIVALINNERMSRPWASAIVKTVLRAALAIDHPLVREQTRAEEERQQISEADTLRAAINYAVDRDIEGLEWLKDWNEGDLQAMTEFENYIARGISHD